ncbi:MAG: CRTAC1 family protein [Acidobacteriota bacterium]|nr:CRTAC1 family protein [Acidobacteriota bacterium]MDH3785142.1 CRTAC1 family protein [Acidobacteriota bacterium]
MIRRWFIAVAILVTVCGPSFAASVAFSDQTVSAQLIYSPGSPLDMDSKEMYHGGSVGDFNRDGWPDLFLLGGGMVADALFINDGDGTFTNEAIAWGVDFVHRGRGSTVGDYNNDGWPDLYVTSGGDLGGADRLGQHRLYENNGNGTFTERGVAAGVNESSSLYATATGAAFGDYDLDGDLDLFVCGWEAMSCHINPCEQNRLFQNQGNGTFTDVTVAAEIANNFDGFSPRFVDMNGDRYPELIVAADYRTSRYFVNDGDGTFTNATGPSGTGEDDNGMGTTVADFNRDGLPDWYVTSIWRDGSFQDGNYLYVNQGSDTYSILPETSGARDGGWGWGTEAIDFDHDGWVDLIETNGWWETTEWTGETSYLYRNNGDLTFTEVQNGSGFSHLGAGRSVLTLDYDRDGDMDVVVTSHAEPVQLFRNDISGVDANWIELALDTSADAGLAPDGYGAKITATTGGVTQSFWLNGGASYLGRSQAVAHFGLGAATTVDIDIEWSDGTTTSMPGVAVNQILTATPAAGGGAPGEASGVPGQRMRAVYNPGSGEIDVEFTSACDASNHTIVYGDLASVSSYVYSGASCFVGASGTATFDPGMANAFFMVVGHNGTVEGSYGQDRLGAERPDYAGTPGCDLSQDLAGTCVP